jgi:predicted nucleotidyltransferase
MTLAKLMSADERLGLLDALIYGDVFDCAPTLDELCRYARVPTSSGQLVERLRDDPVLQRIVVERDGLFCLAGRTSLLDNRPERIRRARHLQRRARAVARVLRHVPFVAGILLTGSTSADDASEQADIDLLVVVTPNRLGTGFLFLGTSSRILGRRLFCPNWYVREGCLGLVPRNLYIAREFAQARCLVGSASAVRESNPWLIDLFPNALEPPTPDAALGATTRLQGRLEAPLRGALGDHIERWACRVAASRLRAHYAALGREVPAEVSRDCDDGIALRFHGYGYQERTIEAYEARRSQLAHRLDRIESQLAAADPSPAG